ncbi:hypothetical protein NLI96_g1957 [Meripilus lineatus]|uniref:Uncharacterized protein n=1 Tax=Meripilus lineatus TaxID=2056292 RepID=A0AAD5V988_9APHY|nr:hypothetical protein NLI96_g1957 [Physisporinus lineatus]
MSDPIHSAYGAQVVGLPEPPRIPIRWNRQQGWYEHPVVPVHSLLHLFRRAAPKGYLYCERTRSYHLDHFTDLSPRWIAYWDYMYSCFPKSPSNFVDCQWVGCSHFYQEVFLWHRLPAHLRIHHVLSPTDIYYDYDSAWDARPPPRIFPYYNYPPAQIAGFTKWHWDWVYQTWCCRIYREELKPTHSCRPKVGRIADTGSDGMYSTSYISLMIDFAGFQTQMTLTFQFVIPLIRLVLNNLVSNALDAIATVDSTFDAVIIPLLIPQEVVD